MTRAMPFKHALVVCGQSRQRRDLLTAAELLVGPAGEIALSTARSTATIATGSLDPDVDLVVAPMPARETHAVPVDKAPCALALVPEQFCANARQTLARIAVAFDGSGHSFDATHLAGKIAESVGASVRVMVVIPDGVPGRPDRHRFPIALTSTELGEVHECLDDGLAALPRGIYTSTSLSRGVAGDVLADEAAFAADLLILGSRDPRPGWAVAGPTAMAAAVRARCPILIAPASRLRDGARARRRMVEV